MGEGQTRRQLRQLVIAVAAGVTGAGALAGCQPGAASGPPAPSAAPARLLFGRRSSAAEQPVLERYVASYRQVAPQITVELAALPSGLQ
jgi:hypothetical protein